MALRIAVLVSGTGSLLQALLDAEADHTLNATVVVVGADNDAAQGLGRAEQAGVPDAEQTGPRDADDAPGPDDARHRDEVTARS